MTSKNVIALFGDEVNTDSPDARMPEFAEVFEQHFDYIWSSCRRLGVPAKDAEDIAQEVFVTAFRRLPSFDPTRPIRPWLFGIAYRVARGHLRKARHRYEVELTCADPASDGPDPALAFERATQRAMVIWALGQVGEKRRAVFILHDIDETPMAEVASALEIPLHTGYSRLRRAREEFAAAVRRHLRKTETKGAS